MRNFLYRFRESFMRFMYGRYGGDELSRTMVYAGLALLILSYLPFLRFLNICSWILFLWAYFRMFSKNIYKRQQELSKYYKIRGKLFRKFSTYKQVHTDKTHRYFKCKSCGTYSRVPKGKGKIRITCKKCGAQMIKRT
ncbi:MAG: hypothetical protein IJC78_04670 [Clostridia bacterium]|nr:hypothetical protein [Clostridia bacterium]